MTEQTQSLIELVNSLSAELQQEVHNFAKYLADTKVPIRKRRFKLDWAGDLSDLRDPFTSVELQHDIVRQWDEDNT